MTSTHQISHNLHDAFLSPLHNPITLDATAGKAHCYSSVLISNLTQYLTTPCHKMAVMLGINIYLTLNNVFLQSRLIYYVTLPVNFFLHSIENCLYISAKETFVRGRGLYPFNYVMYLNACQDMN